nr:SPOR domain-containing protein [Sphingomonas sp.]
MRSFPRTGTGLVALATCLVAAPAFADVKAGVDAWARGDYRTAVEEWRPAAIAGDADAQFNLGQAYKLGRGVPVDPTLAESWFRKAAAQGHLQAADNYGLAMFQSGKRADAVPWLEKSVARGEPRAQLVLGTMLFNGDGVTRDYPRAYALMTLASQNGLKAASETLAQMDQYITPADRQKGIQLVQQYAARAAAIPAPATLPPQAPRRIVDTRGSTPPQPVQSVQSVPLPPSTPATAGASYPVPGQPAEPPRAVTAPRTPPKPQPQPQSQPQAKEKPPAKAKPQTVTGGPWRIQLGAFRDRGNATGLWQKVRGRLGGAQPHYVTAGGVTRLQAGGYANRGEAQAACSRSGQPCVVVAP